MTPLTRAERETIITTSMADDTWTVSTYDPAIIRKFLKFSENSQGVCKVTQRDDTLGYCEFVIPKKSMSFRVKKPITEAQREMYRERMLKLRKEQQND